MNLALMKFLYSAKIFTTELEYSTSPSYDIGEVGGTIVQIKTLSSAR